MPSALGALTRCPQAWTLRGIWSETKAQVHTTTWTGMFTAAFVMSLPRNTVNHPDVLQHVNGY